MLFGAGHVKVPETLQRSSEAVHHILKGRAANGCRVKRYSVNKKSLQLTEKLNYRL